MAGAGDVVGRRALNRATLARQLLLGRRDLPVVEVVERLAGLNAQDPEPPYLTLWARLAGFERDALTRALEDRSVVRGSLLRGTQHMATAARPRSCSPSPGSAGPWPPRPRPGT
jgi:hypothetical protein